LDKFDGAPVAMTGLARQSDMFFYTRGLRPRRSARFTYTTQASQRKIRNNASTLNAPCPELWYMIPIYG
jgi:hypothetical protein